MTDISNEARWDEDWAMAQAQTNRLHQERVNVVDKFMRGLPTYGPISQMEMPVPTLTGLAPNTGEAGAANATVTVTGTNFLDGITRIDYDGTKVTTTYISPTQVSFVVPLTSATAGAKPVKVVNGAKESTVSNFTVTTPPPPPEE